MITFCCLLPDGTIEERTRIGLSATVAEVPQAIGVWRADARHEVAQAIIFPAPAPGAPA